MLIVAFIMAPLLSLADSLVPKHPEDGVLDYYFMGLGSDPKIIAGFDLKINRETEVTSPMGYYYTDDYPTRSGLQAPTITAYVGDVISFDDLSEGAAKPIYDLQWRANNSPRTDKYYISKSEFLNKEIVLDEPGTWDFYLNVQDSSRPYCFSVNGSYRNLQYSETLGDYMYWYFTHVRVEVELPNAGVVTVNHVNHNGSIIESEIFSGLPFGPYTVFAKNFPGYILNDTTSKTVNITRDSLYHTVVFEYESEPFSEPEPHPSPNAVSYIRASYFISFHHMGSITRSSDENIGWFDAPVGIPLSLEGWAKDLNEKDINPEIEEWFWNIGGVLYTSEDEEFKDPPSITEKEPVAYSVSLMVKYKGKWSERARVGLRFIEMEFTDPSQPPNTSINTPKYFYPREITDTGEYENVITWDYESPSSVPYKHSIVSLDKRVSSDEWETVINEKIQTDRQLNVTGNAGDEYRISVKVVDQNNQESSERNRIFSILNPYPDIEVILNDEIEDLLGITVENLQDEEIEQVFPTAYTRWNIQNKDDEILMEGEGEAPEWVNLDERFESGIFTVTQYASNIINTGYGASNFIRFAVLDFDIAPDRLYESEGATIIDFSKAVTNKQWNWRRVDEGIFEDLYLDENNSFTVNEPGLYEVELSGNGFLSLENDFGRRTKNVEFLSAKPIAGFGVDAGLIKMYKKISLDGALSLEKTDQALQNKHPIQFEDIRTVFVVEPLMSSDGEIDLTKNDFIKGVGREIIDNKVCFKGKAYQDIRIDKEGWYRVKYKVYNGIRESDYAVKIIYVQPELLPAVDFNIPNLTVYRDPDNQLKSVFDVIVLYNSPDDAIDLEKSKLSISVDFNRDDDFSNDGIHSEMCVMKDNDNLLDYINIVKKDFKDDKAEFKFEVDNEYKNFFGRFKFEFTAVERPIVPNYVDEAIGLEDVPVVSVNTDHLELENKTIFIDNLKPTINIQTSKENTLELFIFEIKGNPVDVNVLISQLEANRIKAVIYVIKRDGSVDVYKTSAL